MTDNTATILRLAANRIREAGWTQGEFYRTPESCDNGDPAGYCVLGAIYVSSGIALDFDEYQNRYVPVLPTNGYGRYTPEAQSLEDAFNDAVYRLAEQNDAGRYGLATWNDEPQRTKDEVITALEAAAEAAEREKNDDSQPVAPGGGSDA